jgi:hypothetical protein
LRPNPYHRAFVPHPSICYLRLLPIYRHVPPLGRCWNSRHLANLRRHCFLVRPGPSAEIATQSLPPCVCTASFSLLSSTAVHLPVRTGGLRSMLGSKASRHLFQHCFCIRPGTSAAIAPQFLAPCVCTASFSLMSSTAVHLPARPLTRSMVGFKASFHLLRH